MDETTILAPHIAQTPGVRGGRPYVEGKGVAVHHIAACFNLGLDADTIACQFDLSPAEVHAALAFYLDHRDELDAWLADDDELFKEARKRNPSLLREKLGTVLG